MGQKVKPIPFRPIACSLLTGRLIFGGAFYMHDTIGLPLGELLNEAERRGITISIPEFVRDARRAGWKQEKIERCIKQELSDSGRFDDVIPVLNAVHGWSVSHELNTDPRP